MNKQDVFSKLPNLLAKWQPTGNSRNIKAVKVMESPIGPIGIFRESKGFYLENRYNGILFSPRSNVKIGDILHDVLAIELKCDGNTIWRLVVEDD